MRSRMGKRGVFLFFYLVMLTVMMCGIVWGLYIHDQSGLKASLVSPLAVLEVQDELEIFEMRERELIRDSLDEGSFGESGFEDEFKERFLDGFGSEMREFVFGDLVWRGAEMDTGVGFNRDAFLDNVLYSVDVDSGDLVLRRSEIGKRGSLRASDSGFLSFPVDFEFSFDREYLVSEEGGEIVVEVLG